MPQLINSNMEYRQICPEWIGTDKKLTEKSLTLLEQMDSMFKGVKKTKKDVLGENAFENIVKYRETFPAMELPSGKQARNSVPELEKKFIEFFTLFPHITWERVHEVTKAYVDSYAAQNYNYMKRSAFFISKKKDGAATEYELADYCEAQNKPANSEYHDVTIK